MERNFVYKMKWPVSLIRRDVASETFWENIKVLPEADPDLQLRRGPA